MARKVVELSESETLEREQFLERIGQVIKKLRIASGMTQRELALASGMSQVHFVLVEAGGPAISVVLLYNIAKVLGVPMSIFFEDDNANTSIPPVLVKLAVDLRRMDIAFEAKSDSFSKLVAQFEKLLEEFETKNKD